MIRAVVRKGERVYGDQIVGFLDGWKGVIEGRTLPLDVETMRGTLPKGGTVIGTSRTNPYKVDGGADRVQATLADFDIDALIAIGGEDTLGVAHRLFTESSVRVVGVPKTIDNDLNATELTFGFDTAVQICVDAIDRLHTTAESHDRVMVVEVMGRYAGWIALCAGIAGGADVVVIPEMPYDIDRIANAIRVRSERGSTFSIVVVGEGARPRDGARSTIEKGRRGHLARLGGAAQHVADQLEGKIPHELRVTVLGHLQRGGTPSAFDRVLGTRLGVKAALCCANGDTGLMVALRGTEIVTVTLADALQAPKLVPTTGELVDVARSVGIELGS